MIYTITMNPALDYVVDLPEFKTNQVNRVVEEHIFYGGKGINVAVVLKELGFDSCCFGFTAGFTGKELERGVQELGIKSDFVHVSNGLTRINVKIHSQQETELNGLGPVVSDEDIDCLYEKLKQLTSDDVLVISGSVPSSMSLSIYDQILKRIDTNKVKVVIDATGDLLKRTLKYKPFLIKPNNHELAELFNVELKTIDDIEKYARKLQDMGAINVLISMAKDGSLLIDENGNKHRLGVCKGTVKNSVGAGDSMVAGFIAGYLSNLNYQEILKLATAAGGATAFSSALATKEKIQELLKQL
ncbi:1-phosphofructokinase [Thomasclavelia sp.]|uniref:1-phosphofructokinase n=1 Tax=Thomasclavelia sp. TaxID=3025757 RepID=UPI0025E87061|nr:1-phosphofructokinase [Thomasclavelia sp.]